MAEPNEFNKKIIDEFRANGGKVGAFAGAPMVLLTTTGARSGEASVTPLVCLPDGERILVFASKAGAPKHPGWYHNLLKNPEVTVEWGSETFQALATDVKGEEHDRLYSRQAEAFPNFAEYQKNTTRIIPVVALERQK